MQEVHPLTLQKGSDFNFSFCVFNHRFRYARLLYVLGNQRQPKEMIPDPPELRFMGWAYFQCGVCAISDGLELIILVLTHCRACSASLVVPQPACYLRQGV